MNDANDTIEIWSAVIGDLLHRVPPEHRAAVLAKATACEAEERQKRDRKRGRLIFNSAEFVAGFEGSPRQLYRHEIMRAKSKVAYVFVRDVTNNHSAADAAKILFGGHRRGVGGGVPGSGYLAEYLDGLERVT